MSRIWFVRHGESESNANWLTSHPTTVALTPQGEAEAAAVVAALGQKPDLVVVSPYKRAQQTAEFTISHFAPVAHETWPVYEFTYIGHAHYLNTRSEERRPFKRAYWERADPHYRDAEETESFAEFMARVQDIWQQLRQHPAEFIVVFTHGIFMSGFIWSFLTNQVTPDTKLMRRFSHFVFSLRVPNGAILKMHRQEGGPYMMSGFETAHLSQKLPEID